MTGIFLNTAESYVVSGPRLAIDGTVRLDLSGGMSWQLDHPGIHSKSSFSLLLHNVNTTVFSAINAGDVIVGSVTVGSETAPAHNGKKDFRDILGSSIEIGESALSLSARAGLDVSARYLDVSVPGTAKDTGVIVMNLAANANSVTGEILTRIVGISTHLGDLESTVGGVTNSGRVMVGFEKMNSKIAQTIRLGD